ncbi:ExbD/TolR family protein [Methylotenera versatilis]|uniref:Biopolymer transport protein ExbD/TolR n=1 Tax=Methylotenera versatilis (strain 301) TaxID=666681 RepID=D7DN87_METV0|nr:biopolymer transporter ExbD [Methylotenera versatilis]ADI30888.1 Biopolymer transport protein ExbD/TolR [Methylotenera versatilis 301]
MIGSGNGVGSASHTTPMSEINTTPLVDVMLVLLVIFIITAPLLTHAVKIDLPQASSQPLPEKPEVISVSIDAAGKMYWNDAALVQGELKVKLQEIAGKKPQPELNIRADKETRYQVLAEVMADAQNAGVTKLGFVSEPKK